jgi:hypothetical protein
VQRTNELRCAFNDYEDALQLRRDLEAFEIQFIITSDPQVYLSCALEISSAAIVEQTWNGPCRCRSLRKCLIEVINVELERLSTPIAVKLHPWCQHATVGELKWFGSGEQMHSTKSEAEIRAHMANVTAINSGLSKVIVRFVAPLSNHIMRH